MKRTLILLASLLSTVSFAVTVTTNTPTNATVASMIATGTAATISETLPSTQVSGLAPVAITGSYGSLLGLPTIPTTLPANGGTAAALSSGTSSYTAPQLIALIPTNNNQLTNGAGYLTSGSVGSAAFTSSTNYATAAQGAKADTAVQPGSLATVATTGTTVNLTITGTEAGTYVRTGTTTGGALVSPTITTPTGIAAADVGALPIGGGTVTGNIVVNGTASRLPNQVAATSDSVMTQTLTTSAIEQLILSDQLTIVPTLGWVSLSSSGGANMLQDPTGDQIYTTSGTNAYCIYSAAKTCNTTYNSSTYASYIPWNLRVRLKVSFSLELTDSNTIFRCQFGRPNGSAAAPGDLAQKGIGFQIVNAALQTHCHNGTAPNTSGTLATLSIHQGYDILLDSDGAGNLKCYLNGTLVGTLTGAPTTPVSSGNYSDLTVSVSYNGAATNTQLDFARMRLIIGGF